MKNISFDDAWIIVRSDGCLYLTDCKFFGLSQVDAWEDSSLDCFSCFFDENARALHWNGIKAHGPCELHMFDCVFGDVITLTRITQDIHKKLIENQCVNRTSKLALGETFISRDFHGHLLDDFPPRQFRSL